MVKESAKELFKRFTAFDDGNGSAFTIVQKEVRIDTEGPVNRLGEIFRAHRAVVRVGRMPV